MISSEDMNVLLEKLGSDFRAIPNTEIAPAFEALFKAIPEYVERVVDEKLAKALQTQDQSEGGVDA